MCGTCGCGDGEVTLQGGHARDGEHEHEVIGAGGTVQIVRHRHGGEPDHHDHGHHDHGHHHHGHGHDHHHHHGGDVLVRPDAPRRLSLETDILAKNDALAAINRARFAASGVLALNLMSSPGSGKTTLLVETLKRLGGRVPCAVIEGDQQTSADADRIRATGTPAVQVNTGKGCHLEADMVGAAADRLALPKGGVLFIENVGNLVCPAGFDLGEGFRVVLASVTEGEDKPLKYPNMFASADLVLITKSDLLPHLEFDVSALEANARRLRPGVKTLRISSKTGEGMEAWTAWLSAAQVLKGG
jgi:hydrogenase nickel incorporation protein HypB